MSMYVVGPQYKLIATTAKLHTQVRDLLMYVSQYTNTMQNTIQVQHLVHSTLIEVQLFVEVKAVSNHHKLVHKHADTARCVLHVLL